MQEAYCLPCSKCSLCWSGGVIPSSHDGGVGVPHPVMVGYPRYAPPSRPGWGVPIQSWWLLGRVLGYLQPFWPDQRDIPSSHGGGTPGTPHHPDLARGVSHPVIGGYLHYPSTIQTWPGGIPGTPHHPDLAGGTPSSNGRGVPWVPLTIQTWLGGTPSTPLPHHPDLEWGTPLRPGTWYLLPLRPGMGYPPDLEWGTSSPKPGTGYPPSRPGIAHPSLA